VLGGSEPRRVGIDERVSDDQVNECREDRAIAVLDDLDDGRDVFLWIARGPH
jgi:hypothetical protein